MRSVTLFIAKDARLGLVELVGGQGSVIEESSETFKFTHHLRGAKRLLSWLLLHNVVLLSDDGL